VSSFLSHVWIKFYISLTFGFLSFPDLPSRPSLTLVDEFRRMRITIDAPSSVSKPENYQAIQKQTRERILDDRPEADHFIPPISLLYDGFGVFDDVIQERSPVDGEDDILGIALWDEVNAFANRMAGFYATEADRRSVVHDHLDRIFRARRDPQAAGDSIRASRIGSGQIISDGHSNGAHGAMVICIECKNELSGISCEPLAELVSYVARSFKEQMNGEHQALFQGWRVPALGMTMIGEQIMYAHRPHPPHWMFRVLCPIFWDCYARATDARRPLDTNVTSRDPD